MGPPGSGKTTLVASYVKSRRLRTLWYQADAGDSDVATFFYYMSLAAKQAGAHKRKLPPRFGPEHTRNLSAFARVYFYDLFSRLKPPFAIVLDNCQDVPPGSNFHDIIAEGIRQMPRGGWAVLVSRSAPPTQFAQLRAGNDVQILGWEALRLTLREAAGIARLREKRSLARKAIQEAHRKSDGWAAGLVLMLEQAEIEGAGPKGGAASQTVFDYFAHEILERQDPETRNVMLKTSMLGKITGRAAVELTGIAQASRVLADLNSRNYFTEKRGQTEPVYQYHPLFREFLLAQAKLRLSPATLGRLRRKAARLLVESGSIEDIEDAVGLLRASADWRTLARLIAGHASSLIAEARHHTLEEWLKALPSRLFERNGWLRYWLGASQLPFKPAESRVHFDRAFHLFRRQAGAVETFVAWCGAVESILYEWNDFKLMDPWIDALQVVLQEHPAFPSPEVEARVTFGMFAALMFRQPHHAEIRLWAERALARARRIAHRMKSLSLRHMGLLEEAQFAFDREEESRGLRALRTAMALGRRQGYVNPPWWLPQVMARLCARALEAGIEIEYVRDLVRRRALVPESPPLHVENWPWAIKIHSLGSFRLLKDGRPLQFSRKTQQKPLMLLKVLIALGRENLPEEELADALWPEAEGDAQHRAFNVTLHRLRQLLGHGEALVVHSGLMTLDPRYCWVDIHAFDRLLDQAEHAERNGEEQKAADLTEKALELYRGDFLAEETKETWAVASRERLRTKFLRSIVKLVSHLEEARRCDAVIEWCERGLAVEELAEELYQRQMLCYKGLGRRAEALSVYERCRKTLAAVLGVTPSPQTEALHRKLLRG